MKSLMISAAVVAAFFVAPSVGYADDLSAAPLVLAKDTKQAGITPTFAVEDFPWGLPEGRTEDVMLPFGKAVLTMPWMEVEKDGDDLVIITTPEMAISKDEDGETEVGLQLDDAELQVRRVGDAMAIAGFAKELVIGETSEVRMNAEGFEFSLTSRGHELAIEAIKADAEAGSDQVIEAMRALNFAVDYSAKSARVVTADPDGDNVPYNFNLSSGPLESGFVFGDGRIEITAESTKNVFAVDGPIPVDGEIGLLSYGFSMPVEASESAQPMDFGFEVSDVSVSDTIWNLADPKKIFPRALDQAKFNMAMNVILKDSMFDSKRRGPGADLLKPVDGTLTALEFDGLGLDVSANGDVEMDGELAKDVSGFLSVAGLSEFMKNVVKAGFVPQSQAILGEGIALQFAKEEDDGSLTFDLKTDDGIIIINGNRVAPLPR